MNGRSVDKFLQDGLNKIFILNESETEDGKYVDIAELNAVLGVLNLNSKPSNIPVIKDTDNVESSKCIKFELYATKE